MKASPRSFWLCALISLLNAFTSTYFSIATLPASGQAHVTGLYGVNRSLTLALVTLLVVGLRSQAGLLVMALLLVVIQAGDTVIGVLIHDPVKTYGPALLAVLTLAGLVGLFRSTSSQRLT